MAQKEISVETFSKSLNFPVICVEHTTLKIQVDGLQYQNFYRLMMKY